MDSSRAAGGRPSKERVMAPKAKPKIKSLSLAGQHSETETRRDASDDQPKGQIMKTAKDTFEDVAAKNTDSVQKGYDQVLGATREQLEKASASAFKAYEEFSKFQKDNYDAYVAASSIFAKGAENVGKAWMSLTQEAMENAAQTAKALLGAKTLREAVDLQSDFAKANFDKLVAESTKLSELSVKVANEAFAPINARVNVAVEKMLKPVAA
jgi:phasin family protein